jgi:hypothetical protein
MFSWYSSVEVLVEAHFANVILHSAIFVVDGKVRTVDG